MWFERGPITIPAGGLPVDTNGDGTYRGDSPASSTIPAGTVVCSYFINSDRTSDSDNVAIASRFSTSGQILGVIFDLATREATTSLNRPGTRYVPRGIGQTDSFTIDGGNLAFDSLIRGDDVDQIRVITAC